MAFDRLHYVDRLEEAGIAEPIARAHAEALRDALVGTVATKSDLNDLAVSIDRRIDALDRKIEITARDLTIRGAGGLVIIATLIIGLKLFN